MLERHIHRVPDRDMHGWNLHVPAFGCADHDRVSASAPFAQASDGQCILGRFAIFLQIRIAMGVFVDHSNLLVRWWPLLGRDAYFWYVLPNSLCLGGVFLMFARAAIFRGLPGCLSCFVIWRLDIRLPPRPVAPMRV